RVTRTGAAALGARARVVARSGTAHRSAAATARLRTSAVLAAARARATRPTATVPYTAATVVVVTATHEGKRTTETEHQQNGQISHRSGERNKRRESSDPVKLDGVMLGSCI